MGEPGLEPAWSSRERSGVETPFLPPAAAGPFLPFLPAALPLADQGELAREPVALPFLPAAEGAGEGGAGADSSSSFDLGPRRGLKGGPPALRPSDPS